MVQKVFETQRLSLNELTGNDWKDYLSHVLESQEIWQQYGLEPTEELIEEIQTPTPDVHYRAICLKSRSETIGIIGILEQNDNLEYYIFPKYRGNHYCSEALAAFAEQYFSGELTGTPHDTIAAEILSDNKASACVLLRAGFQKAACGLRLFVTEDGGDNSSVVSLRRYELHSAVFAKTRCDLDSPEKVSVTAALRQACSVVSSKKV